MTLMLALALALQADPKPPTDIPPIGKGKLLLQETFELAAPGQIPDGWQKTGEVAVAEDQAHTGRRSLRIEAAKNGPRRITFKGDILKQLGGQHWGRLYFRIKLPTAVPSAGVIHSTLVSGTATSPLAKDPIEVRPLDTILTTQGSYGFIYNVQPQKRPEFGKGSPSKFKFSEQWTLAEWYVDFATQTYRLFINGEEIKEIAFMKGAGKFENSEIPESFETMSFGWNNYQAAEPGFTAWIDDIALAKDRIGARGILPPPKKKR